MRLEPCSVKADDHERMSIAVGDAVALARELVRVDSRNPVLVPGARGEAEVAGVLAAVLESWGFTVELRDAAPGRPNVIARIGGGGGGRSLMLNGHLDTVGIDGMTHDAFDPVIRDGRLHGRGACDMKSGVAAMCAAAARAARQGLAGEVIVAAVIDEELESLGTRALLEQGVRTDAAIVTEPTRLSVMPAHRGFVWMELRVTGRAAHGSRYDIGVDAIRHAGLVLAELDRLDGEVLPLRTHPLLGRGSLHASTITGGTAWSIYPDSCTVTVERRTLPGESADDAVAELRAACTRVHDRLARLGRSLEYDVLRQFSQSGSEIPVDAPIVRALGDALESSGAPVRVEGASYWTDMALLNEAGIPSICYGPGDIALAHGAEEWIEVRQVEQAADVIERLIGMWCGAQGAN